MSGVLHRQPPGVHEQNLLDHQHLLPAGEHRRRPTGGTEATHRLLPVDPRRSPHPGISLLLTLHSLAHMQRQIRNQREQPRRGSRDDPERAVSGTTRQNDQVHDPPSRPLFGIPARVPRRMLRHHQTPPRQIPVSDMRQQIRQLFSRTVHVHEGTVFHERYMSAVHAKRFPRHRV